MYAKQGNFVDADATGYKVSSKHLESRLEVIQDHAFSGHWKADEGLVNNVGFGVGNIEGKVSPFFENPTRIRRPLSREPEPLRIFAQTLHF